MDALSKYGQFHIPSKLPIDVAIRNMNSEIRKLSQIDQLEIQIKRIEELRAQGMSDENIANQLDAEGLSLKATGFVFDSPTDAFKELNKEYNELKKAIPSTTTEITGKLKSTLDAVARSLSNRIIDIKAEIAHFQRTGEKPNKKTIVREDNDAIKALRAELAEQIAIRDELFHTEKSPEQRLADSERIAERLLNSMIEAERLGFPDKTPVVKLTSKQLEEIRAKIQEIRVRRTEAKREGKRVDSLDGQIAELERKIAENDIAPKPPVSPYTTPMIEARIARRKELQAALKALQAEQMPELAEQRTRRLREAALLKQIADLKAVLSRGDFSPKPKK